VFMAMFLTDYQVASSPLFYGSSNNSVGLNCHIPYADAD
jgi:hypothetical protein